MKPSANNSKAAFQLKGSMLTFTVLQLLQPDDVIFATQLDALVKKSPTFFKNAPILIDLEKLQDAHINIDFDRIKAELSKHGLIPVGIRNANDHQAQAAAAAGLGLLTPSKQEVAKPVPVATKSVTSKMITQPVRSGQQIYAQQGDLIVLASVSPGAELMADGNIHVYGTLRGRAIAGVNGNLEARIFCHKLEAELISIAGYYQLRDDIRAPQATGIAMQIYLEEERLKIAAI